MSARLQCAMLANACYRVKLTPAEISFCNNRPPNPNPKRFSAVELAHIKAHLPRPRHLDLDACAIIDAVLRLTLAILSRLARRNEIAEVHAAGKERTNASLRRRTTKQHICKTLMNGHPLATQTGSTQVCAIVCIAELVPETLLGVESHTKC